jgi:diguanylate cyclase (GGDEF)-like protein
VKSGARRAALRAAVAALVAGALAGSAVQLGAWIASGHVSFDEWWWASTLAAALAASLAAANAVRRSIGRRLTHVARLLDGRVQEVDFLARLPEMGDDEVGRIAASFNRMLARMTTLQGTVIDRSRELEATQRALALSEALGEKQRELEQRATERALLFEVLRESASSHDLDRVLEALVTRVGPAMRMRHLAVVLRTEDGRYVVRAAFGFEGGEDPVGSEVARPGGPWAVQRGVLLVPDIERVPQTTAFWDRLPKDGSFASVPIKHAEQQIGFLVLTRSEDDPLGEHEGRYLQAVADQAALAIHNAQLVARLERLSMHDELTGLANRRLFSQHLERALARADRYEHEVSVLAIDIDHFKQLNDRCGHPAGDAALRAVSSVLSDSLREVDTLARAGGEEFWVLLAHTGETGASEVAEKLRRRVASIDIEGADAQPLGYLSVSIGVATRRPGESAGDVLARADVALYVAKRGGRDRVASAA